MACDQHRAHREQADEGRGKSSSIPQSSEDVVLEVLDEIFSERVFKHREMLPGNLFLAFVSSGYQSGKGIIARPQISQAFLRLPWSSDYLDIEVFGAQVCHGVFCF